jgi:hypothetical protein
MPLPCPAFRQKDPIETNLKKKYLEGMRMLFIRLKMDSGVNYGMKVLALQNRPNLFVILLMVY